MMYVAVLVAWTFGILMVALLWPRARTLRGDLTVIVPLGAFVGLGATSALFFVTSLWSERPAWHAGVIEVVAVIGLLWRVRQRWIHEPRASIAGTRSWLEWLLAAVLVQVALVAAIIAWRSFQAEPLGGWDGWAIWNMHARFMLRAGTHWPELLAAPQLNWTHPDYPRLVPASVARIWAWAGREEPLAAALVSVVFAAATVALLVAAVAKLRGGGVGLVGGIVLLATPFFATFASNEHADIPLGSFMLAAILLVTMPGDGRTSSGAWALAGICAGFAAWTKNEGLLFAPVFAGALIVYWRKTGGTGARSFFAALTIALLPVAYFKLWLAPANDLVSAAVGSRLGQIMDPERHAIILSALWRDLGRFGEWQVAPWLALGLPFLAWRSRRALNRCEWLVPIVIGLMSVGYYGVYLTSPQDLGWHLDTSLVRLLLQLWPLTIFMWCLVVPNFAGSNVMVSDASRWVSNRAIFVVVNCVAALAAASALTSQRAARELAVRRIGFEEVSVALGDGWFPLEKHANDEWSWSGGRAKLAIYRSGDGSIRPITLRFSLGSVEPRTVTIRDAERELWRGPVSDRRVAVTITGLRLSPGTTPIEFTTDTASVSESPAAGGRSLAFAIYNVKLE